MVSFILLTSTNWKIIGRSVAEIWFHFLQYVCMCCYTVATVNIGVVHPHSNTLDQISTAHLFYGTTEDISISISVPNGVAVAIKISIR